jgi:hypothetical protein
MSHFFKKVIFGIGHWDENLLDRLLLLFLLSSLSSEESGNVSPVEGIYGALPDWPRAPESTR